MFSEQFFFQELVVLIVALGAVLFVFQKLTGFPRLRKPTSTPSAHKPVQLGPRLARGLGKANRLTERRNPRHDGS